MPLVRTVSSAAFLFVLFFLIGPRYLVRGRDSDFAIRHRSAEWLLHEDGLFAASGVCAAEAEKWSRVATCGRSPGPLDGLSALKNSNCFCDDHCHVHHDCCIDFVLPEDRFDRKWACRMAWGTAHFPIYVLQSCPLHWRHDGIRRMCEVEASVLEQEGEAFSYLQDVPVKSRRTGVFYRSIFCALCNDDRDIVQWSSYFFCSVESSNRAFGLDELDFSEAVYSTRTESFKRVKVGDTFNNCRLFVDDFSSFSRLAEHGARLCKPAIDTCPAAADEVASRHCGAYTSFVYEGPTARPGNTANRIVYKNFHCALCNNASVTKLKCHDPVYQLSQNDAPPVKSSLSFLFDFNFDGGGNQIGVAAPCKLRDGKVWDPVLKQCINFTCGKMFERKGSECVPITDKVVSGALNDTCPKTIIGQGDFYLFANKSVFVNDTGVILSEGEYEVHETKADEVASIIVCVDEGSMLLHLSKVQFYLSEVTLSLSIICLILHLFVYCVLRELRNCPGKVLMSLSTCLLCGHFFLLIGPHIRHVFWLCYACGVLMHFGYLSSFLWMSVMAYDIYRTFSSAQSRNGTHRKIFIKYSVYSWTTSLIVSTISVLYDNLSSEADGFRPKYGHPICWFNQRKGVLVFFILPIFALLLNNAVLFSVSSFRINRISQQTKMVGNFSDRVRYFLYIKLSVVFGLTWVLGLLAGLLQVDFLWYLFIILNGLQGVFIFISFTAKRKIGQKLLVKFRVHSDKYRFGSKDSSGLKKTMYSSLSNLSSLQTTLTAHLPALEENPEILKSVRKINPDALIKQGKL